MDKIGLGLVTLISNSNLESWVSNYDCKLLWMYQDGTKISSLAIEHSNVSSWLEMYDELPEKIIDKIGNIGFSDSCIEELLIQHSNLLEFNFKLNFEEEEICYRYVQFGEGNEAARSIDIPLTTNISNFSNWMNNAIKNNWHVTLSD